MSPKSTRRSSPSPIQPAASPAIRRPRLLAPLIASCVALAGCGLPPLLTGNDQVPTAEPANSAVAVVFGHSASEANETSLYLSQFQDVVLPEASAAASSVQVTVSGDEGFSTATVVAHANLDVSAQAAGNYKRASELSEEAVAGIVQATQTALDAPPAQVSDPFGAISFAALQLQQYPGVPRQLVYMGDGWATAPSGCLLAARDLTRVQDVLANCAPNPVDLDGVEVSLIGLGTDLQGQIDTARALGLITLYTTWIEANGGDVVRVGATWAPDGTVD
jgi:hypothetical protein